jgi:hypothetical protein
LTLGEIGINRYSTITVEVKPFVVPHAMALEDIIVKVQDYMSITKCNEDGNLKLNFDTDNTVD